MYAVVINSRYTGVVYDQITDNVTEWCTEMGATLIEVTVPPVNIGTDEDPDYGSPSQEDTNNTRISEIKSELERLDTEAIRPLRAIAAGFATEYDHARLANLDAQAAALREELVAL